MCEGKKDCGCGCSTKKQLTESAKKKLNEGTWAPEIWSKSIASEAKNILQGLIDTDTTSLNVSKLLDRFERKFYNKIGDDQLYALIGAASNEFIKKPKQTFNPNDFFPGNWKNTLGHAITRINELEKKYTKENKLKESHTPNKKELLEKINLRLTSNTKIELVKQAKIALDAMYALYSQCERRDIEHNSFLDLVDDTFEHISELLAVLIGQQSIEVPKK